MEIRQGKGQFCQRDPNIKFTISKNGNQTGQRPILSEGFQSKIYYFKNMEIKQGIDQFCQMDQNIKSTIEKMEIKRGKGQFVRGVPI